jgi:hypothetical protein
LTTAGDKYFEISIENCKNEFWKDVLHAWQYILSKITTNDSRVSFFYKTLFGIIINAFSTKTGIERVSG